MKKPWEETWTPAEIVRHLCDGYDRQVVAICGSSELLCISSGSNATPRAVADANAKLPARAQLAAAAPDLYRALVALRNYAAHLLIADPRDLVREADAAIAKATRKP